VPPGTLNPGSGRRRVPGATFTITWATTWSSGSPPRTPCPAPEGCHGERAARVISLNALLCLHSLLHYLHSLLYYRLWWRWRWRGSFSSPPPPLTPNAINTPRQGVQRQRISEPGDCLNLGRVSWPRAGRRSPAIQIAGPYFCSRVIALQVMRPPGIRRSGLWVYKGASLIRNSTHLGLQG
jgi:hypothetical protein